MFRGHSWGWNPEDRSKQQLRVTTISYGTKYSQRGVLRRRTITTHDIQTRFYDIRALQKSRGAARRFDLHRQPRICRKGIGQAPQRPKSDILHQRGTM